MLKRSIYVQLFSATNQKHNKHHYDHIPQQNNMSLSSQPLPLPPLPPHPATAAAGAPPRRATNDDDDDKETTL